MKLDDLKHLDSPSAAQALRAALEELDRRVGDLEAALSLERAGRLSLHAQFNGFVELVREHVKLDDGELGRAVARASAVLNPPPPMPKPTGGVYRDGVLVEADGAYVGTARELLELAQEFQFDQKFEQARRI
ncbi:MAG: hypothetical protein R2939_20830, partial [Kofleriaceae bacterium]